MIPKDEYCLTYGEAILAMLNGKTVERNPLDDNGIIRLKYDGEQLLSQLTYNDDNHDWIEVYATLFNKEIINGFYKVIVTK